jgi:hypothetical protein
MNSLRGAVEEGAQRPSMWREKGAIRGYMAGMDLPKTTSAANFNPGDSGDQTSRNITAYRQDLHDNIYTPMLEETIGQIGRSGMVDRAQERAQTDPGALQARMDRQQSRMGGNMSVAAQQYQQSTNQRQGTLRGDWNVNNARIAEDEFDAMGRRSAINVGTSMLNTAQQGAMQAANAEAGVKAANAAGQSANNAAWIGVGTAALGMAI